MSIKIPQQGRFSQPNTSDLFGNIWYSRNMNFDEQGYAKLSSRSVSFKSDKADNTFDRPISFGRDNQEFHIVTADTGWDLNVLNSSLTITKDTGTGQTNLTDDAWGKWFQNRFYKTIDNNLIYTTGGNWTVTGVSLTSGKVHALETFKNKNSLAVTNGNTVLLLDTSHATTVTLTVPSDFECVGLAYSNGKMGIITMMSDAVAGQNQEAYFFIWDGGSTEAGFGFPMGSDTILAICAYKSSWVIFTRTGELKYFNGGGFDTLATMPFATYNTTWGDAQNRITFGDVMVVEGDRIYLNIGNDYISYGRKGESYVQNNPSGIWCYDPNVGLYHRYSHSISPAYQISVSSVNTTTDILTCTGTLPATGNPIKYVYDASDLIGGLQIGIVYYIIKHTATTFSLATTKANAEAGAKINLTSDTTAKFLAINVIDYGASFADRVGGIGFVEYRQEVADHIIFGAELNDFETLSQDNHLGFTVPRFENRGYFVTAKATSPTVLNNTQKVYLKYRPLDTNDKIVLKYKDMDILGLPTSTPQWTSATSCTWASDTTLTTTADLSEVESYINDNGGECEVEIISGAGAGQLAQIDTITENAGTYTITLSESIDGAANTYVCDISIDNWKLLKTKEDVAMVTSSDTLGYKEFPIATSSKWILLKTELRGSETCVEELELVNSTQLAAL